MPRKDRESQRQYVRELWERKKSSGLCVECSEVAALPRHLRCEACAKQKKMIWVANSAKRRAQWKAAGLCNECGGERACGKWRCDKCRQRRKISWIKYRDEYRLKHKAAHRQLKIDTFNAYGGCICACCRETHLEFLSIDHMHGTPRKNAKERAGFYLYGWLKKHNFPLGFRVLCMNCNFALGHFGSCPHQPIGAL